VFDFRTQTEWPFGVVVLSSERRAAIVESSLEEACRRTRRLLHQAGAGYFASDLPESRTPFAIENKGSHSVAVRDLGLTIALVWLRLHSGDSEWPRPVIVAALGPGGNLTLPTLEPDAERGRAQATWLRQRGLRPAQVLELPAVDRRNALAGGRAVRTVTDVLDDHSVVEEVVRATIAGEPVPRVA
jgi:hypothetical protein